MSDIAINSARIAWMREHGAVQASWNDAGELVSATIGPPPPPPHVPSRATQPDPFAEQRRVALSAGPSIRRTGL